jgi:glycosyltransferase involved in cell wall biosynthesis
MKQLHWVRSTSVQGGGEAVAASKYARALALAGVSITIVSRDLPDASSDESLPGLTSVHLPWASNALVDGGAVYRCASKLMERERPDLVHLHGLWSPFLAVVAWVARKHRVPIVISPHGCMEPWALNHKRLKKQLALWLYQGWVLRSAAMYMVTSEPECGSVRRLGLNQPVAIVPNGVDVPDHLEARRSADVRTLLFLSRLHPGKGLLDLVEAWAAVRQPGWRIVIAGGDEGGHQAEVEGLIHQKGLASDFTWVGFVNGEAKQACFAQADVFVLPTHSENFGIAIAEALAYGLPVITTTGAPWPGLLTHRCGWWVEPGVPGIASALTQALACSPEELNAMGQRGRQWVAERFAWANIGADAALACAWLLDRSQPPPDGVDTVASYN